MTKKHGAILASASVVVGLVGFGCGNGSDRHVATGQPPTPSSVLPDTRPTPTTVAAGGHNDGAQPARLKCPNGTSPYLTINDYFDEPDMPERAPARNQVMTAAQDWLRETNYPFIDQPGPLEFTERDRGRAQVIARAATGEPIVHFELIVIRGEWRIETIEVCAAPMGVGA